MTYGLTTIHCENSDVLLAGSVAVPVIKFSRVKGVGSAEQYAWTTIPLLVPLTVVITRAFCISFGPVSASKRSMLKSAFELLA